MRYIDGSDQCYIKMLERRKCNEEVRHGEHACKIKRGDVGFEWNEVEQYLKEYVGEYFEIAKASMVPAIGELIQTAPFGNCLDNCRTMSCTVLEYIIQYKTGGGDGLEIIVSNKASRPQYE